MSETRSKLPPKNPYAVKFLDLPKDLYVFGRNEADAKKLKGKWKAEIVSQPSNLHVELGSNAGHVIREWAKTRPDDGFVGIDWKFKQVYRFIEKIKKSDLKNIMAIRANQEELDQIFSPSEINSLHLYFPDPWPKKSHLKNRVFKSEWLKKIHPLLKGDGYFYVKTDHRGYFDHMLEECNAVKNLWSLSDVTFDLHKENPTPEKLDLPDVTLFEKLFIKKGLPIHALKLKPISASAQST